MNLDETGQSSVSASSAACSAPAALASFSIFAARPSARGSPPFRVIHRLLDVVIHHRRTDNHKTCLPPRQGTRPALTSLPLIPAAACPLTAPSRAPPAIVAVSKPAPIAAPGIWRCRGSCGPRPELQERDKAFHRRFNRHPRCAQQYSPHKTGAGNSWPTLLPSRLPRFTHATSGFPHFHLFRVMTGALRIPRVPSNRDLSGGSDVRYQRHREDSRPVRDHDFVEGGCGDRDS